MSAWLHSVPDLRLNLQVSEDLRASCRPWVAALGPRAAVELLPLTGVGGRLTACMGVGEAVLSGPPGDTGGCGGPGGFKLTGGLPAGGGLAAAMPSAPSPGDSGGAGGLGTRMRPCVCLVRCPA